MGAASALRAMSGPATATALFASTVVPATSLLWTFPLVKMARTPYGHASV